MDHRWLRLCGRRTLQRLALVRGGGLRVDLELSRRLSWALKRIGLDAAHFSVFGLRLQEYFPAIIEEFLELARGGGPAHVDISLLVRVYGEVTTPWAELLDAEEADAGREQAVELGSLELRRVDNFQFWSGLCGTSIF